MLPTCDLDRLQGRVGYMSRDGGLGLARIRSPRIGSDLPLVDSASQPPSKSERKSEQVETDMVDSDRSDRLGSARIGSDLVYLLGLTRRAEARRGEARRVHPTI